MPNNTLPNANHIADIKAQIQSNYINDMNENLIFRPHSTKEWSASIYSYNKSYMKSLITINTIMNKLVLSYCNMLKDNIKPLFKHRRHNKSRYSANRIYLSKVEVKHTNTKINVVLHLYNKQKSSIEKTLRKIITLITNKIKRTVKKKLVSIGNSRNRLFHIVKTNFSAHIKWGCIFINNITNLVKYFTETLSYSYIKEYNIPDYFIQLSQNNYKSQANINTYLKSIIFNKHKFNNIFLCLRNLGLTSLIEKLYKKEAEMGVVELKSIGLSSNALSSALALKLRDRKNKALTILRKAIDKMVRIPDLHTLITFDDSIEAYNKNNVVQTIKQQIVSGLRIEAKGRLTRRLTAQRSIFKKRQAGSLKNINSSFNEKSASILRGCVKSNSDSALRNSKTRNGAFGLKVWISSHNTWLHLLKYLAYKANK